MASSTIKKKIQKVFRFWRNTSNNTNKSARSNISNIANNNTITKSAWKMIFRGSEENFVKNGALLLEEMVSLFHGKANSVPCSSVDNLCTDFEDWVLVSKETDYYWHKCVWKERPVLVKLFHEEAYRDEGVRQWAREIAVATQMGIHNNVLKLVACCLETKPPVLIYEYVENQSLMRRILRVDDQNNHPLGWNDRLRIAWEISHAVAYLHTAFPRPIIHRDLKPSNVYLDQDNVSKLADFSLSISIPEGKTFVEVPVQGTLGYIAPEDMMRGHVAESLDVYSFGTSFFELLTGKAINKPGADVQNFYNDVNSKSSPRSFFGKQSQYDILRHKNLDEFVDPVIIGSEEMRANDHLLQQQLQASVELIIRCTALKEESRPTVEEVATELKNIITASESSIPTTSTPSIHIQ